LEFVEDVVEVEDHAIAVAAVQRDDVGVLEEPMSILSETVGPTERAGSRPRDGPESIDIASAAQPEQATVRGLD
jgi:hypothetical protein